MKWRRNYGDNLVKEGYCNQFLGGDNSVLKVFLMAVALTWLVSPSRVSSQVNCNNPIVCENTLTGNPQSEWDISGSGDPSIQGFATDISVNRGQTINFKINTTAASYRIDIYRLGYYGGLGARKVATITPTVSLPQTQPPCVRDASTGLVDCGNWALSAAWAVPTNATSGLYIARPVRLDTGGASHIVFIVRDDAGRSDLLFQTSDTTWQAYNSYGGGSLYPGPGVTGPGTLGQSFKVSYNRPFNTRDGSISGARESFPFTSEYPMIRWLEMNGYNVSYASGADTDRRGSAALTLHKVVLSVGHDEYWSGQQRVNVEAARAAGVNLGFFSGNEIFWKTRWENSIDGNATSYRTLVCYKETWANAKIDPAAAWTGTWRDPRFSPPSDGGRPENALSGQLTMVNAFRHDPIVISSDEGKLRFWRNTGLATLGGGQTAQLPAGVLGYEWDEALDNGFLPPGLIRLSTTSIPVETYVIDYGGLPPYAQRTVTHNLTLYRHSSGSLVFGAGTTQWPWGLDTTHDLLAQTLLMTAAAPAMENYTDNVPYDLGMRVMSDIAGQVTALRFWKCSSDTGTHVGHVWSANGQLLASITFANETASGWQQQALSGPLAIGSNIEYVVSVSTGPGGYLPATLNVFGTPLVSGHLRTPAGDSGRFGLAGAFPTSNSPHNYFRDLEFVPENAGADSRMQQATVNLLADMGAQPVTLQPGLVIASASTDIIAPTSVILTPLPGTVTAGSLLIVGTATDAGGGRVAAVEFSVDGGTTWHPAGGTTNWTATWTAAPPAMTIRSRATDDSARVENPGPGVTLTVNSEYTLWPPETTPNIVDVGVPGAVELGVKFQSDTNGWITALRFYKSAANTGVHVGNLWATNGTLLATVTFAGETTSGWQEAPLPLPVLVTANTTYIASYHTDSGNFSIDVGYFAGSGVDSPPLRAPADGIADGNGVYHLGAGAFPADKSQANNYWVDVVFAFGIQTAIPVFAPPGGTYGGPGFITLSDATPGAQIYYTTDGSTPTTSSTRYSAPIAVTSTTTIKAIALASGWSASSVASATYTLQAAAPTFSPSGGTYSSAQSVTLLDTSPGAQIRYTTNGSTPTASSTLYTAPIPVTITTTINAIAVVAGWNNSTVASATYTLQVSPPPAAPSALGAIAVSASQINLSWVDNATNETGFKIERKTGAGGTYAQIATVGPNVTVYSNNGLTASTTYFYRVRSTNSVGDSAFSAEVSATTSNTVPTAPIGLTATPASSSQINLSWVDVANETGFKIERKTGAGGTYTQIATVAPNVTVYTNTGLTAATMYFYRVRATNAVGDSAYSIEATATTPAPGLQSPWSDGDIGSTGVTGSASYSNGTFTVRGSGADIWDIADAFHFVYQTLAGDGDIIARVMSVQNTDPWAKAGVMIRENLTSTSTHAMMVVTPGNGLAFQRRLTTGATSTHTAGALVAAPYWVRLVRIGNTFTGYASSNGVSWTLVGSDTVAMATNVQIGLAVTAHNNAILNTSVLDNVSVIAQPDAPSSLTALAASSSQINLSWVDNASDETGFKIERKTGAGGIYAQIATVGAGVTTYTNTGLAATTTYFYRVRASNSVGDSTYSTEASATTLAAVPAAPSSLTASPVSSTQINLSWVDNASNETGFKIERKTGAGGTYAQIATVGAGVTTYTNTGLTAATTYFYRVRATNTVGDSAFSTQASATTFNTIPAAPSSLTASPVSSAQIRLSWVDNASNESGFKIERKTGAGGIYAQVATVGAGVTTYTNTGLAAATTYFYRVRATNSVGDSAYSAQTSATTLPAVPAAPSGLTASSPSTTQIRLSWVDNATNETGFKIERKTGAGGTYAQIATVGAGITIYTNTGLIAATTYFYRVRATNAIGDSAFSLEASATTLVPTFRGAASAGATSGLLALIINKPAGTQQGDVMVASIAVRPSTAVITVAGWTLVRRIDNTNANANSLAVYYKVAGASEPANYSWTFSTSTGSAGGIQSFSGVDTANPVDVQAGQNTASGLTNTAASVTTRFASDMIVTSHAFSSSATFTSPTGMTEAFDVSSDPVPASGGEAIEGNYRLQTAVAATGTPAATASNDADTGNAHTLALKAK